MDSQLLEPAVDAAVGMLAAAVDALLAAPLDPLTPGELSRLLDRVETQRHRLDAVDVRLLAHPGMRTAAFDACASTVTDHLITRLRVERREARARVRRAEHLGARSTLTGDPLPALTPAVAAALTAGEIGPGHADAIITGLDALPDRLTGEAFDIAEQVLIEAARHQDPAALRRTSEQLKVRLDPDGPEPNEAERCRSVTISPYRGLDGLHRVTGNLTPEARAVLTAVLDALAAPQPADDGTPDPRSPGARNHDALLDLATRALSGDGLPDAGGTPASVIVHVHATEHPATEHPATEHPATTEDANTRAAARPRIRLDHIALLGDGHPMRLHQLMGLLDQAEITTVRLSTTGGVLSYGRERRCATPAQRRALTARDRGCAFPGCTRPPAWCEAHHVVPWLHDGLTEINNLILLCGHHHRSCDAAGWAVHIRDGLPWWTPPATIDPHRRPVRNTAHHHDITFPIRR